MTVVSVNKGRGKAPVAWRAWACSPKDFKQHPDVLDAAIDHMLKHKLLAIGYNDDPLNDYPHQWFWFKIEWKQKVNPDPRRRPSVPFYFARRMRKDDLVVLARNRHEIVAYGYLADNTLRYVDREHQLDKPVLRLQRMTNEVFSAQGFHDATECFRNYRLIDKWIPFKKGIPQNDLRMLDANYRFTISAVTMQHGLHWLGMADAPKPQPEPRKRGKSRKRQRRSN